MFFPSTRRQSGACFLAPLFPFNPLLKSSFCLVHCNPPSSPSFSFCTPRPCSLFPEFLAFLLPPGPSHRLFCCHPGLVVPPVLRPSPSPPALHPTARLHEAPRQVSFGFTKRGGRGDGRGAEPGPGAAGAPAPVLVAGWAGEVLDVLLGVGTPKTGATHEFPQVQ